MPMITKNHSWSLGPSRQSMAKTEWTRDKSSDQFGPFIPGSPSGQIPANRYRPAVVIVSIAPAPILFLPCVPRGPRGLSVVRKPLGIGNLNIVWSLVPNREAVRPTCSSDFGHWSFAGNPFVPFYCLVFKLPCFKILVHPDHPWSTFSLSLLPPLPPVQTSLPERFLRVLSGCFRIFPLFSGFFRFFPVLSAP